MNLILGYLYPKLLNIYGDRGNILTLKKRCQWRGINFQVKEFSTENQLDIKKIDLFFGGGGQDKQQKIVAQDLQKKKEQLKTAAEKNIPMLTICGTYQLFGEYFLTKTGRKIPGIGILDVYTVAGKKRKTGNIVVQPNHQLKGLKNKLLVGFENHSGNTKINKDSQTKPLGKVKKGHGNNSKDKTEGAVYKNIIGTYLHGPVLPKNPHLADYLIKTALTKKYEKEITLKPLNDSLEWQTHKTALQRAFNS